MGLPRLIFYYVGRGMTVLAGGFGLAFDFTGISFLAIAPSNWGIIGLISFGLFVVITMYREIDLALQQSPKIEITPIVRNNRAILKIYNKGGRGNLTAWAKVIGGILESGPYRMYWEAVNDIKCPIDGNGGLATILVGERANQDNLASRISQGGLQLAKMGTSKEQWFGVATPLPKPNASGYDFLNKCVIEVTLTAEPALRRRFENKQYEIGIDVTTVYFREIQVPDMEGSQT